MKKMQTMQIKPKSLIGDQALEDLVEEEFKQNVLEESERYMSAKQGSSWFGKVLSNTFNYDGKTEFDFELIEAKQFIVEKVDTLNRYDMLFEE